MEKTSLTLIVPSISEDTDRLSPPLPLLPQVTTDPSARRAAKATDVEATFDTSVVPSRSDALA